MPGLGSLKKEPCPIHDLIGQECQREAFEEGTAMGLVVGSVGIASRRGGVQVGFVGGGSGGEELDGGVGLEMEG